MRNGNTLFLISIFTFFVCNFSVGQIKGKIVDADGNPLPYATIYIDGTTNGTISNAEGEYILELSENREYRVIFQYVGYKKEIIIINYFGKAIEQDVTLFTDENVLKELTITADREDPAYEIVRNAINKRQYYKNQIKSFEADLYVKGVVKITDAPKKILGEEIGNMNGILDTARQGIVYLSESKSKFYYQHPGKTKEIMISSVKSGDNSLFTANQFSWASFDLYDEYINLGRTIVSPLADNAFSHYKFRLEQFITDRNGIGVNKIKIIPKTTNGPLISGYIYIANDLWNIYSTDLVITGQALKNTFLDSIEVRQVFIPVEEPDRWRLLSQVFSFKAGVLGFKLGGTFSYIFSDYVLNKDISGLFSDNETFRVEKKSLKKDTTFWNTVRPIPLTTEEQNDYIKKDSLQLVWNSKTYMDSTDRIKNRFTLLKLLTGYTFNKSYKNTSITIPSPLSTMRFNAVEGFNLSINPIWEKEDSTFRKWTVQPLVEYGFSDKRLKTSITLKYRFDNYNQGSIFFRGGRQLQQFDAQQPINERNNTWTSLWNKINNIRLFQNDFASFGYAKETFNGFFINLSTMYTSRQSVFVNTQYSFRHKKRIFAENIPRTDLNPSIYSKNTYWKNTISLLLRPAQKYSSYPYTKIRDVSDWPNIFIDYESGIPLTSSAALFHKLSIRIRDKYVNCRLLGYFSYNVEGNTFLGKAPTFFGDFFHPLGNQLQSPIGPDFSNFNLLPYYEFSTDRYFLQVNFRHHFNGFIFDKIPLVNKTSLKFVIGFSGLYEKYKGQYYEPFIGIENFKLGPIHLFDVDYSWAFDRSGFRDSGITFRLSQILNN